MITDLQCLDLPDSEIYYVPDFLSKTRAENLFEELRSSIPWRSDKITVFGKTYDQPRLTAWFGEEGISYSYSGITMQPTPFPELLMELKTKLELFSGTKFNSCLANLYRDGQDSNGWHADDEKELGTNPVIASLSLGESRAFHLRYKSDHSRKEKLLLTSGSLLLMLGATQHHWHHQVPKTKRKIGSRINLTFRCIK
ncbi:MAG: alpha-ketoglutarate-dependent dioxygenase AlkB [Eudoraea sp.]|nr:alpha-ketoglutarate-dependent dioxygenase AlkB [Eudoraea sp.]